MCRISGNVSNKVGLFLFVFELSCVAKTSFDSITCVQKFPTIVQAVQLIG